MENRENNCIHAVFSSPLSNGESPQPAARAGHRWWRRWLDGVTDGGGADKEGDVADDENAAGDDGHDDLFGTALPNAYIPPRGVAVVCAATPWTRVIA